MSTAQPSRSTAGRKKLSLRRGADIELFFLSGPFKRGRGRHALPHKLCHLIEISGAHKALMADALVTQAGLGEFALLQRGIGGHASLRVAARQLEHTEVQRVEPSQGHELELVAHGPQLALESSDG